MIFNHNRRHNIVLAVVLLLLVSLGAIGQEKRECLIKIKLLQVNDVYQFGPVDRGASGGLGRLLTLRRQIAGASPYTLFLLSGDTISPSVESNTFKGKQMIDAWNAVGLDFSVFGNHEFDFGPDVLRERIRESRFGWLGANVIDKTNNKPFGDTPLFAIREFGGVKLGIFGITLPETKSTSRPGPNIEFREPCETARQIIPQMRAQGANVIVALTHLTMKEDKELAHCAPGIDIIIGGHEHNLLQSLSERTPIFKMTSDAREMGEITLNVDASTGKLQSIDWEIIEVNSSVQEDPTFVEQMKQYEPLLRELSVRVGRTDVPLNGKSKANRTEETNLGNFVADAFRQATGADVALLNGGSIRADDIIPAGDLSRRDVLSILPFNNPIVRVEVSGATLRAAIEHGVSQSAESTEPGRFPQVSGMRYSFDASRPVGSRVIEVTVGGRPLDDKKMYTLATSSFIVGGGDGYEVFKGARVVSDPNVKLVDSEILGKAIAAVTSISPKTEGRIKRLDRGSGDQKSPCAPAPADKK